MIRCAVPYSTALYHIVSFRIASSDMVSHGIESCCVIISQAFCTEEFNVNEKERYETSQVCQRDKGSTYDVRTRVGAQKS